MKTRPRIVAVTVASAAAAVIAVVAARCFEMGLVSLPGTGLTVFLIGAATCAISVFLFQRGASRRARVAAIGRILPRRPEDWIADRFFLTESDAEDDVSGRAPRARAEIRAATRALLVSLEEELRQDGMRHRRHGRPACRRARLRAAGRSETRRRRVPARVATIPS